MTTSIQVSQKTLQLLERLKGELAARSFDQVLRDLVSQRKRTPRSMFGSNPKLRPFFSREGAEETIRRGKMRRAAEAVDRLRES